MPTDYTYPVQEGTITTFRDFALLCARAFGATIMMRDEPLNAVIPEAFEPSTYHRDALNEAQEALARYESMSLEELKGLAFSEYRENLKLWEERVEKRRLTTERYQAMLDQVRAWTPPTPDHEGLKDFMIQQLVDSIRFDNSAFTPEEMAKYDPKPELLDPEAFRKMLIEKAEWDINYHRTEWEKEVERTEGRNAWLRQLRESLPSPDEPKPLAA